MILEVIHYYIAPGNVSFFEDLKHGVYTILTTSTFFLSNSVITWELNNGKLYICEIYSKHHETYEKSYVNQILEGDNKVFHDWINCEILLPGYLIPCLTKAEGNYLSIKIKGGYIEATEYRQILEEYDKEIF